MDNKIMNNKEQKKDEKRIDKLIKKYTKENGYTDEEIIYFNKRLIEYLAHKKRIKTAEMPIYEYTDKKTEKIIYITREHALELKRQGEKIIPVKQEKEIEKIEIKEEEENNINEKIDLSKVKREKWAEECWNGKNLINTRNNFPKGKGIIDKK